MCWLDGRPTPWSTRVRGEWRHGTPPTLTLAKARCHQIPRGGVVQSGHSPPFSVNKVQTIVFNTLTTDKACAVIFVDYIAIFSTNIVNLSTNIGEISQDNLQISSPQTWTRFFSRLKLTRIVDGEKIDNYCPTINVSDRYSRFHQFHQLTRIVTYNNGR